MTRRLPAPTAPGSLRRPRPSLSCLRSLPRRPRARPPPAMPRRYVDPPDAYNDVSRTSELTCESRPPALTALRSRLLPRRARAPATTRLPSPLSRLARSPPPPSTPRPPRLRLSPLTTRSPLAARRTLPVARTSRALLSRAAMTPTLSPARPPLSPAPPSSRRAPTARTAAATSLATPSARSAPPRRLLPST